MNSMVWPECEDTKRDRRHGKDKDFTGLMKSLYFILQLMRYCWRILDGIILDFYIGRINQTFIQRTSDRWRQM